MPDQLRFSQNFLHSKALVKTIVALAQIPHGGTVLEIGPGKGIITQCLAEAVGADGRVVAVELDHALSVRLREQFSTTPQVHIHHADILQFDLNTLGENYQVFSNVPFNVTSEVLDSLFTQMHSPRRAHLILQVDALISRSEYGDGETLKSLMLHPRYHVAAVRAFARTDFTPQPSVETALFAFERRAVPLIDDADYALYKDFLAFVSKDRVGEGVWRKVLGKNQLELLAREHGLVPARGLKSQQVGAMVAAFQQVRKDPAKLGVVRGAMLALRQEQARRESINQAGGHHRSKSKKPRA